MILLTIWVQKPLYKLLDFNGSHCGVGRRNKVQGGRKGEKGREKDERAFPFSSQNIVLH